MQTDEKKRIKLRHKRTIFVFEKLENRVKYVGKSPLKFTAQVKHFIQKPDHMCCWLPSQYSTVGNKSHSTQHNTAYTCKGSQENIINIRVSTQFYSQHGLNFLLHSDYLNKFIIFYFGISK